MASNFEFLREENTLYELALFAEDLIVDGTTKLEYITAIDNMRKVLGLMLKRWVKKCNLTADDIKFAARKLRPDEYPDVNMRSQILSMYGYDFINGEIQRKLNDIRVRGNETIHPEKYDDWMVYESSREEIYKIALNLYEELYVCAYTYSVFGQKTKEADRRKLENKKPVYIKKEKNSANNNKKQENKQNKPKPEEISKPETKTQPDVKAEPTVEPVAAPQPEVKAEPTLEPVAASQPEVKAEAAVTPRPEVKAETTVTSQPEAKRNGIARCIIWTPVVLFFMLLIFHKLWREEIALIPTGIYLIWGFVNAKRPRRKKSIGMICAAVVMAVCSFTYTFVVIGNGWGILILLVLLLCSLLCTIEELSYKE